MGICLEKSQNEQIDLDHRNENAGNMRDVEIKFFY